MKMDWLKSDKKQKQNKTLRHKIKWQRHAIFEHYKLYSLRDIFTMTLQEIFEANKTYCKHTVGWCIQQPIIVMRRHNSDTVITMRDHV